MFHLLAKLPGVNGSACNFARNYREISCYCSSSARVSGKEQKVPVPACLTQIPFVVDEDVGL